MYIMSNDRQKNTKNLITYLQPETDRVDQKPDCFHKSVTPIGLYDDTERCLSSHTGVTNFKQTVFWPNLYTKYKNTKHNRHTNVKQ